MAWEKPIEINFQRTRKKSNLKDEKETNFERRVVLRLIW